MRLPYFYLLTVVFWVPAAVILEEVIRAAHGPLPVIAGAFSAGAFAAWGLVTLVIARLG